MKNRFGNRLASLSPPNPALRHVSLDASAYALRNPSTRLAQYHGVVEAARRLHDEHLSAGSYHLFRLPEEVEEDLHAIMQAGAEDEFVTQSLQSKDAALATLKRLGGMKRPSPVGPTAVGSIKTLASTETSKVIAEAYFSAFSQNTRVYPYLVRQP